MCNSAKNAILSPLRVLDWEIKVQIPQPIKETCLVSFGWSHSIIPVHLIGLLCEERKKWREEEWKNVTTSDTRWEGGGIARLNKINR